MEFLKNVVEYYVTLNFTPALAAWDAVRFYTYFLKNLFEAQHIVVGKDFRFGHQKSGNINALRQLAHADGKTVHGVGMLYQKDRFSSSLVRQCLLKGEIEEVKRILGYFWILRGHVIEGKGRGRPLGFPTLNVRSPQSTLLKKGVYAVKVLFQGRIYDGVANYGVRPTFQESAAECVFEVHLLNKLPYSFNFPLNTLLDIALILYLREEKKFADTQHLTRQIERDIRKTQNVLSRAKGIFSPFRM